MVLTLAAMILVAGIVVYAYLRSTLPDYEGERVVSGLSAEVEILCDSWGMPHIYAKTGAQDEDPLRICMGYESYLNPLTCE